MNGVNMTPPPKRNEDGIEKPRKLSQWPRYIIELVSGFFKRLFYIVSLVLEAAPALFFAMVILCLVDGVLPVVGAYISKDLLNEVAVLIGQTASGSIVEDIMVTMRPLLFLFVMYFIYLVLKRILTRVNTMVTNVAGELVVNHIKLKIIGKIVNVQLPLTMYIARHSWASIAKSKNVPISVISEGMGHDSEMTTQIYLASLDTSAVDKANCLILNSL